MSEFQRLILGLKDGPADALIHRTGFRTFTYPGTRLLELCEKMGWVFSSHRVKKGDRVLIWGHNSAEWIIALLGCLLHGVVAVPIDVRHPLEVVKRIAKHSGAKMVLCPPEYPSLKLKRINLDDLTFIADGQEAREAPRLNDSHLAEIVYTSGTTGVPKGVMLSHGNLSANFKQVDAVAILRRARVLNVLPLSHMFGQMGIITCLLGGHSLVLAESIKSSSIREAFREHAITQLPSVPRLLDGLKKNLPWPPRISARIMFGRSFRNFISGGAALDGETEQFFLRLGYTPYVGYGLTETSPVLTCNGPGRYKFQSAGKAVDGTEIKIVEDGEILARGPQVFSGYYKNPQQTRDVLKKGWFYTGDLGSLDEHGFITILGRKKDVIVSYSGVNVYPEDIERALKRISGVKDSCVLGLGKHQDEIHAVLLLEDRVKSDVQRIIDEANRHLDDTSRISSFTIWDESDFPRTPTHKVRKFLVKEKVANGGVQARSSGDTDCVCIALSKFTSKAIRENSTLESLGLSSIDRIELVSDLEQTLGVDIDEDRFSPDLSVAEIRTISSTPATLISPATWPLAWWARLLRRVSRPLIYAFLARPFVKITVTGSEHLHGISEPCIVVGNHESNYDAPTVFWTLPSSITKRLAPAAYKEYFTSPSPLKHAGLKLLEFLAKLTHNIFPLPQQSSALKGLRHAGRLMDNGWNILFYPEGARSTDGRLLPFQPGIGLLAKYTRAPIVPVKTDGLFEILPPGKFWPRQGNVTVKIGKPLRFTTESPVEIVKKIENVLKGM